MPIIRPERLIFIAEDIEAFEMNQFSQGKKGAIIEIIAEDSARPRQHASNDRVAHSMCVPGLINGNRYDRNQPDAVIHGENDRDDQDRFSQATPGNMRQTVEVKPIQDTK